MSWGLRFLPEAEKDLRNLDGSQRILVAKATDKVLENPLPMQEGGYGKPLGNKDGNNLSGFLKIKLKSTGIRIVYKIYRTEIEMLVVIIGARADDEVYIAAEQRAKKHDLNK